MQTVNPTDWVLTERLTQSYNPFRPLGISAPTLEEVEDVEPIEYERDRTEAYHLGRIAYFVREIRKGHPIDPVEVDNACFGNSISSSPILVDGHHRLAAALLLKRERVEVSYSGRVDVLEWLRGEGPAPED